jgi:hypothetical protein
MYAYKEEKKKEKEGGKNRNKENMKRKWGNY